MLPFIQIASFLILGAVYPYAFHSLLSLLSQFSLVFIFHTKDLKYSDAGFAKFEVNFFFICVDLYACIHTAAHMFEKHMFNNINYRCKIYFKNQQYVVGIVQMKFN